MSRMGKKEATKEKAPDASPGPDIAAGTAYHYELVDPSTNADKFWEVRVDGPTWTVRYGRNGTAGQSKPTTEASAEQAIAVASKKAKAKEREGYVLKTDS